MFNVRNKAFFYENMKRGDILLIVIRGDPQHIDFSEIEKDVKEIACTISAINVALSKEHLSCSG